MSLNLFERYKIPTNCPVCGSAVTINSSGLPFCGNEGCKQKVIHRLTRFFDVLGIKGAGPSFISSYVDEVYEESDGLHNIIVNIIKTIQSNDIKLMNKCAGGINGEKIILAAKERMDKGFNSAEILAMFDYEGFDSKKLDFLSSLSIDEIFSLKYEDIIKVVGFADITTTCLLDFLCSDHEDGIREVFSLLKVISKSGKFEGMTFVFTGSANAGKRSDLELLVTNNGGKLGSSVSKKTSYLVTDDTESGSSKNMKAKELGIPIISSFDFVKLANA